MASEMAVQDSTPELSARPVDVQELLGAPGVLYVTPDFQRGFEWSEEQFQELWTDLLTAVKNDNTHFLGQVILVDSSTGGQDLMQIIDGQQRLTTVSILACVLRDWYKNHSDQDYSTQLQRLLSATSTQDAAKTRRLSLLSHSDDDKQYGLVYAGESEDASGNVGEAYEFFRSRVSSLQSDEIHEVRKKLLKGLRLIRTETGDMNSAFQVFQTENNRGMELSAIDFVKSIVFEAAAKDPNSDTTTVKETWVTMTKKLEVLNGAGSIRPLMHILGVSDFECPVQMYKKQFVKVFQDIIREQVPEKSWSVQEFVGWLSSEGDLYHHANAPAVSDVQSTINRRLAKRVRRFRYKNARGSIVVYYLLKEYDDTDYVVKALDLATILSVRLNLANKTASNKRDPIYQIVKHDGEDEDLLEAIKRNIRMNTPSDSALLEIVRNRQFLQNDITRLVLLELEREHFSNNHARMTIEDFQIEHIAPRKAFSKDKYTPWRKEFDHDEDRFGEYCERLGNLTLLADSQNARAGDSPFQDKRPEYRSSEFRMTQKLCEHGMWGYEAIEQRSEELAKLVVRTWSIGPT